VSVSQNPVRIRVARPYDTAALLDLARDLAVVARSPNSVVLLAELGDQL
jgi:hypothetical protein